MERNAFFDNAKALLIFLVVFGHMIQPFTNEYAGINTLYLWIYTFHMPAFILLSGFFAKGSGNAGYVWKLAKKLIVPYLIFQILYTIYYFYIGKPDWQTGMFHPHWSLWFLFSLFSWHILLIVFKKIPAFYSISLAVLIGVVVGYFGEIGHTFSLSRTFVFFPFFLIGYWVTEKQMMSIKRNAVKGVSLVVMTVLAIAISYMPEFNSGWLLASKSYGDLGMEQYGGIARLLVYVTAAIMVVSVLAWIPKRNFGWLTKLGTRTLYVYLLHGFIVQFLRQYDILSVNNILDFIGIAGISAMIVILLSSKPVLTVSQPLIEGKMSIIRNIFNNQRSGTSS
ncbi:acyltransferase family protein [Oceanobacillus kimchii]|uniref:acyltransferase family protein n=1 Tax=Oceanobacillus kimchii TaxID=746691 RepID=UPI0021A406EF|nr:acyltransferase family protein [Oceanobacillus kimchii]MCT1576682.1 acyltransferase family protein [Oceanobacillus kimchii]MCT2134752.1 acyltransferase family protein [Oceanobacillus kimchii]